MKNRLITTILLLSISITTNAQSVKDNYFAAKKAYESGSYEKSVKLSDKVVQQLGKTNVKVQPLLIKSLYEIKDYYRVVSEYKNYKALNPSQEWAEYSEMVTISNDAKAEIREERNSLNKIHASATIAMCDKFEADFPKSEYLNKVGDIKRKLLDDDAWASAKRKSSTSAYYEYLDAYANGKYASTARKTIKDWDKTAFDKAVSRNTQYSYNSYLNKYPKGNYRYEVKRKLRVKKEEDEIAIAESYFKKAKSYYKDREYYDATIYCRKYLKVQPYGVHAQDANKMIKKIERKGNRKHVVRSVAIVGGLLVATTMFVAAIVGLF